MYTWWFGRKTSFMVRHLWVNAHKATATWRLFLKSLHVTAARGRNIEVRPLVYLAQYCLHQSFQTLSPPKVIELQFTSSTAVENADWR